MEFLFDPAVGLALMLAAMVTACVAVLYRLRDPVSVAPRVVSESVWCEQHQQRAVVDFVERTSTGLTLRYVRHCPLRSTGDGCHEECCHRVAEVTEAAA